MKNLILLAFLSLFSAMLLCGCGQASRKLTSADLKAFDGAGADLKQSWARAQAAAATNDYVVAILTLRSMLHQDLSKQQLGAVQNALANYDAKLMKAVDRGDPAA